jgi:hypothetical protein
MSSVLTAERGRFGMLAAVVLRLWLTLAGRVVLGTVAL